MASYNPKHVFDFEGILNMDVDPAHWKKVKKQLEEEFGQLKIALQDGLAEEEAQKYIDQFNKIFRKAKLPEIGLDDLREGFAKLEVNVEKAVAAINNINLDALDDVIHELKLINGEVEKISKNKGSVKLFDKDNLKKVMGDIERIANTVAKTTNPFVKSISEIDDAVGRAKVSAKEIQDAFDFTPGIKKDKINQTIKDIYDAYNDPKRSSPLSWEQEYIWMVKFNKAYEAYVSKLGKGEKADPLYASLYAKNKAGDADMRNMLQNIINRNDGKALVGYQQEPWALENTLQDIKNILKGGLNVNVEGGNENIDKKGKTSPKDLKGDQNLAQEKTLKQIGSTLQKIYDATGKGVYENINSIAREYYDAIKSMSEKQAVDTKFVNELRDEYLEKFMSSFPTKDLDNGERRVEIKNAFKSFSAEELDITEFQSRLRSIINNTLDKVLVDFSEDAAMQLEDIIGASGAGGAPVISDGEGKIAIDPKVITGALSNIKVEADNGDVIEEIKNAKNSLGTLVAQDDTLKSLKDSMAKIQVTPDNSEILGTLKTLAQNVLNLAQEDTLQAIKNENVGLTREDVSLAIQEGVNAKEFNSKYRYMQLDEMFSNVGADEYLSKITGEIMDWSEASEAFKRDKFDFVVPADKAPYETTNFDVISIQEAIRSIVMDSELEKNNWAQVIVEAITDQTGKIIEVVKLLLPPEIAGGIDEIKLIDAFNVLATSIQDFGSSAKYFFEELASGGITVDFKLRDALETLGLLSDGKPSFKKPPTGAINTGMAIAKELVISTQPNNGYGVRDIEELIKKQNKVYEAGGAVPRIISGFEQDGVVYQLQARAPGVNHRKGGSGMFDATDEQIDRLIYTFEQLIKEGLFPELHGDNIMYDRDKGFTVIDLSLRDAFGEGLADPKNVIKTFLRSAGYGDDAYDADTGEFEQRVWDRFYMDPKDRLVNANTVAAEKAREQAAAQAARQKGVQEINITTDNSDVVEAVNKLGQNLGTMVAQEDTLQAIKNNLNSLTKEDIAAAIQESVSGLTKEDIIAAIKEVIPRNDAMETDAPWALETTLNTTIKNILEKIQSNTAKLNGIEIKHAVEENTQATKQAAGDVSGKIENASAYPDLDKVVRKQDIIDGTAVTTEETRVRSELTDEAFRTVKDHFEFDDEGNPQFIFREVIDDLNKLRKANKQDENARAKAQKKVNEFLAKFESKTGGTAKFIPGFSELKTEAASDNFITNKGDIDKAYNRMLDLQKEYAKLETNFRKGQSSLNPFVNAINKAQNIENTFGAVEIRFNGLVEKSEELTTQFGKLRTLSGEIKTLTERMNTDPDFSVDDFQKLSVLMGEFTTTKNQVDGLLKNEAKVNKAIVADQKARIKEWVKLSKQLGVLEAKINSGLFDDTVVEQAKQEYDLILKKIDAVVANINDPSDHLVTVGDANIAGENKTINNEMSKRIGVLAGQYEQLGRMQARAEQAGAVTDREKYEQLKKEVTAETEALRLNEEKNEGILNALQLHQENAYVSEKDLSIAKDRNKLYNEWLELVKEISSLDATIDSGLFDEVTVENAKASRGAISKQIDAIVPQLDLTREDYIFAGQESMKSEQSTILTQRQKLFKSLAGDYEKLGAAQGKFDVQQTNAAREKVDQLLKEIEVKKAILNLTADELSVLEAIEAQERENSSATFSAKDRDKAARAELNAQKKLSRRQALVGKAGSAIGRADGLWLEAKSLEDALPKEFLDRITAYEKKLDNLKIKHNELSSGQGPVTNKQKDQLIEQTNQVNKLTDELGQLLNEYQRLSGANSMEMGATTLGINDGLDDYKKELTSAVMAATNGKAQIKSFDNETKTLNYTVKTGTHEFTEYTAAVRQLDHQMVSLKGNTKRTETFFEATKRKMSEISSYMSGMALLSRGTQEIKKGIQYIREIDLALTELKKVTNETEEEYEQFLKTAAKTGSRLGSTISAVTDATATFAKLGYTMEQATEMAEAAIVYKNVGDNIESTGDAANSIISTMKGFGMEASDAMAIVDRFNEVGNKFAITSQGIGEALRLSASALNEGGNSLDEAIGLITAANEVVNDPSSVGTALKTLTLRLRGSKTELEEMGEDVTGMAETTSQLQAKLLALTGGRVDIMLDANTFKDTTQIIREMANAWDTMTDIQQANALELMGGKRQANILSALISNFDTVEKVIETSANSTGSALKENERYLDSIQGKIDQFNNAVQAMWNDTLDSDVVKNFVELGTTLVKILDAIGPLNIAFVGLVTFLEKKYSVFSSFFKPANEGIDLLRSQLAQAEKDLQKKAAAHKSKGTVETAEALKKSEDYYNSLQEKVEPYEDVDRLRKQREDLLVEQSDAQQRVNVPLLSDEAKKDLIDINTQLDQTNKELAEAEARLAKIDKNFKPSIIPDVVEDVADDFDPKAVKKNRTTKKRLRTNRIKKLEGEGKSTSEIMDDPMVKQYTKEIEDANKALDEYAEKNQQVDVALKQKNATTAQAVTAESAKVAAEKADNIATGTGAELDAVAALATDGKTASTWKDVMATAASKGATLADVSAKIKQLWIMKLLNTQYVKNQIQSGLLTKEQMANMTMTKLLGLSFKSLGASIVGALKSMVAFITTPIGAIVAIVAAVGIVTAAFIKWGDTTKNLREDLENLKSEISDIQSQLGSLNDELKETQERMAELLAKDSLTFTEKEELDNLKKQNDELEREIYLLEAREKRLQSQAQTTFEALMGKRKNLGRTDSDGDVYDKSLERRIKKLQKWSSKYEAAQQALIAAEQSGDQRAIQKAQRKLNKAARKKNKFQGKVDAELNQYLADASGIDYDTANEQTKKYLDYIYNTEGRLNIIEGGATAKSHEIKRIFNKSGLSEEMDKLVEQFAQTPGDQNILSQISLKCQQAQEDLNAVGLSVQDAVDYFTMLGAEVNFSTLNGKIDELSRAAASFEKLLDGETFKVDGVDTGLADLFDAEGKIIQTKLSQIFQDTSEQTRSDITQLLEGSYEEIIKNGTVDTEKLLSGFAIKSSGQVLEIHNQLLAEQNLELFPGLEDEIDGIIDKFEEFSAAVGDVVGAMDTLEQARAEEAYSGSISIETLENLMKYTDDYIKLVEIDETGAITLAKNAEEQLIDMRIAKIKADAQAAVQTAKYNLEQANYNQQAVNETGPIQAALTNATDALAGSWAFLASLMGDFVSGNFSGILDRAKAAYEDKVSSREENRVSVEVSLEEYEKAYDDALAQQKIANALTSDNINIKYDSGEASGNGKTKEEEAADRAKEGWETLINRFENRLALLRNERDLVQAEIDKAEARGGQASKEMYDDLIRLELEERKVLISRKASLEAYLKEHKDAIDPETWTEYNNEINATAVAIQETTSNIYEFAQALKDIDMHYFEQATNEISRLADEISWVMSLFDDEEMSDELGNWTEAGITKINLLRDQMTAYAGLANMWSERLTDLQGLNKGDNGLYSFDEDTKKSITNDFDFMLATGKIDQETYDRLLKQLNDAWAAGGFSEELITEWINEAEDGVRDAISAQKDVRDEMLDMYDAYLDKMEEGIEKEIEAYEDLIDAKKKELEAERDLYDFRKNIQNQSSDIASLERRIASLSGSTAASDIAERRRLEAELAEKREALDETYYGHAQDVRTDALDAEAVAFAEAKNRYIEIMRETAEDGEWVINEMITNGIFNADVANEFLQRIQDTYNAPLSSELTEPWAEAAKTAQTFKESVGIMAGEDIPASVIMMSDSIREQLATNNQANPWNQAIAMADRYADFLIDSDFSLDSQNLTTFAGQIDTIISKWKNVEKAANDAYNAQVRTYEVKGDASISGAKGGEVTDQGYVSPSSTYVLPTEMIASGSVSSSYEISPSELQKNIEVINGVSYYKYKNGLYYPVDKLSRNFKGNYILVPGTIGYKKQMAGGGGGAGGRYAVSYKYAKGTIGTKRDSWALTDEPQYGDELVLVPTAQGNLSYMRKGTSVVPADLTANLMEWGQINPDSMSLAGGANVDMINNAVIRPQYDFSFDSLVHVDNCSQETLKDLEKMVDSKIDKFSKDLNYSIKRFAR